MNCSVEAIKYTLNCIAEIAFPYALYNVEILPEPKIIIDNKIAIKFKTPTEEKFEKLFNGTACYSEAKSFDDKVFVKVFFLNEGNELFTKNENEISVNADMISIAFLLLSRYEELNAKSFDKYNRFCFTKSLNEIYDLIDIPIVDEYAMLLRKFAETNFEIKFIPRKSRFLPTHDIDFLERFPNFPKAIKTIAGDLLVRKSFSNSWKSLKLYFKSLCNKKHDPYVNSVLKLVKVSDELKLDSCFYFKALRIGDKDCSYNIFSRCAKDCIDKILQKGMRIGLHGSFYSYADESVFSREKSNLETVSNQQVNCGRQHFLRFDLNKTLSVWQKCGISQDSSLGFAEREGFRCGTCHLYPLFDFENDTVSQVVEYPLIVMDTTLFQYRNFSETEALEVLKNLYERCQAVEGDFVLLWHNTTMFGELESWYEKVYLKFVTEVV